MSEISSDSESCSNLTESESEQESHCGEDKQKEDLKYILFAKETLCTNDSITTENALKLNTAYQNMLVTLRHKLQLMLFKCQERQLEIDKQIDVYRNNKKSNNGKRRTFAYICGQPFFKDDNFYPGPHNDDYIFRKNTLQEFFPLDIEIRTETNWTTKDKINMLKGIKTQLIEYIVMENNVKSKKCKDDEELVANLRKVNNNLKGKEINLLWDMVLKERDNDWSSKFDIDWMRVSKKSLSERHSVAACIGLWNNYLRPGLIRRAWNNEEEMQLVQAVTNNNCQDWDIISESVVGRSPYQCFVHYQSNFSDISAINHAKWIPEEDAMLIKAVEDSKIGENIVWNKVVENMPFRNKIQCYNRYMFTLQVKVSKKPFTAEEDCIITAYVQQHGENFKFWPAHLLPGRSSRQVWSRYRNTLRHVNNHVAWTYPDDLKLMQFIMDNMTEEGPSKISWSDASKFLNGTHTRMSCRTRYYTIEKFLDKHPTATLEDVPRKDKKLSTKVTNENWMSTIIELNSQTSVEEPPSIEDDEKTKRPAHREFSEQLKDPTKIKLYDKFKYSFNYKFGEKLLNENSLRTPWVCKYFLHLLDTQLNPEIVFKKGNSNLFTTSERFLLRNVFKIQMNSYLIEFLEQAKYLFRFPPSWSTIIGLRGIVIHEQTQEAGNVKNLPFHRNEKFDTALAQFKRRFKSIFYWSILLSQMKRIDPNNPKSLTTNFENIEIVHEDNVPKTNVNIAPNVTENQEFQRTFRKIDYKHPPQYQYTQQYPTYYPPQSQYPLQNQVSYPVQYTEQHQNHYNLQCSSQQQQYPVYQNNAHYSGQYRTQQQVNYPVHQHVQHVQHVQTVRQVQHVQHVQPQHQQYQQQPIRKPQIPAKIIFIDLKCRNKPHFEPPQPAIIKNEQPEILSHHQINVSKIHCQREEAAVTEVPEVREKKQPEERVSPPEQVEIENDTYIINEVDEENILEVVEKQENTFIIEEVSGETETEEANENCKNKFHCDVEKEISSFTIHEHEVKKVGTPKLLEDENLKQLQEDLYDTETDEDQNKDTETENNLTECEQDEDTDLQKIQKEFYGIEESDQNEQDTVHEIEPNENDDDEEVPEPSNQENLIKEILQTASNILKYSNFEKGGPGETLSKNSPTNENEHSEEVSDNSSSESSSECVELEINNKKEKEIEIETENEAEKGIETENEVEEEPAPPKEIEDGGVLEIVSENTLDNIKISTVVSIKEEVFEIHEIDPDFEVPSLKHADIEVEPEKATQSPVQPDIERGYSLRRRESKSQKQAVAVNKPTKRTSSRKPSVNAQTAPKKRVPKKTRKYKPYIPPPPPPFENAEENDEEIREKALQLLDQLCCKQKITMRSRRRQQPDNRNRIFSGLQNRLMERKNSIQIEKISDYELEIKIPGISTKILQVSDNPKPISILERKEYKRGKPNINNKRPSMHDDEEESEYEKVISAKRFKKEPVATIVQEAEEESPMSAVDFIQALNNIHYAHASDDEEDGEKEVQKLFRPEIKRKPKTVPPKMQPKAGPQLKIIQPQVEHHHHPQLQQPQPGCSRTQHKIQQIIKHTTKATEFKFAGITIKKVGK